MGPAHQPAIEQVLLSHLSQERLSPYLCAAGGGLQNAISLYRWNIDLSGAVYEALHLFEVFLRNALDEQLRAWNACQPDPVNGRLHSDEWLLDPSALLLRLVGRDLHEATKRSSKSTRRRPAGQRSPLHADLVAAMSMGTWRFLLPGRKDAGKQLLWDEALHEAFPNLRRTPQQLEGAVDGVYRMRNRVAHLEPLIDSRVEAQLVNMRTVIGAIDPELLSWFSSTERISVVLRQRPRS